MTTTATTPMAGMLALGGYHDHKNVLAAQAHADGMTWNLISGGAVLANNTVNVVQDGAGVTTPASTATGDKLVVVNAVPSVTLLLTPSAGQTIYGSTNAAQIGNAALGLSVDNSGTNWT